ncbi:MAG TPA: ABC transporter ATP-binding protein [Aestuariivirgaceae bacterium]|nr:ABC transporter ATP-binding protein [Aestuariivirgaceae bacterium]
MTAAEPLIRLTDVHVSLASHAGRVDILRGLDFSAAAGEAVGIVGPSGSGKTTLLMVMGGLERASRGEIVVDGRDLARLDETALALYRREQVGIVFQFFHLIPTLTALDNVAIPLELRGSPTAHAEARAELDRVGLGHRLRHYPSELSGGEQQRVAIARALVGRPPIILADEPTGNLDRRTGEDIMGLLFALREERRATLLLVTHDPAITASCTRIVEIGDGRLRSHSA